MHHWNNAMMLAANRLGDGIAKPRLGLVSGYDPNAFMVKVTLQPENVETGWLPLGSPMVGNNFGMFCAPNVGDQVEVQFPDGDLSSGIVSMRFYSDVARPLNVPAGECWIVHQSGAFFKLTNDGKLSVNSQVEIDATAPVVNITATGNVSVNAVSASVTATTSASITAPSISLGKAGQTLKSFITDAFIALFNAHTHDTSSPPNQQMSAGSHATNTVKGG